MIETESGVAGTPLTRDQVVRTLRDHIQEILAFGVERLGIFGSVARNEADETSDLDVLVRLSRKTFDDYMGLKEFLEALFERKVDLAAEAALKPQPRPYILNEVIDVPELSPPA